MIKVAIENENVAIEIKHDIVDIKILLLVSTKESVLKTYFLVACGNVMSYVYTSMQLLTVYLYTHTVMYIISYLVL